MGLNFNAIKSKTGWNDESVNLFIENYIPTIPVEELLQKLNTKNLLSLVEEFHEYVESDRTSPANQDYLTFINDVRQYIK